MPNMMAGTIISMDCLEVPNLAFQSLCDGHVSVWLCPTPAILKSKYLMTTYGLSSLCEETHKPALIYRNDFSCFDPRGPRCVNEWSQVSSLTFPSVSPVGAAGRCGDRRVISLVTSCWTEDRLFSGRTLSHWTRSSARIEISAKMTEHPLRPTSQPTTRRWGHNSCATASVLPKPQSLPASPLTEVERSSD